MADNSTLLASIFQTVAKTLAQNKQALNQADEQNHDHGTNMARTFQTISRSIASKKDLPASDALAYAATRVTKEATSGSAKLYAQNLANAATQFKGQNINTTSAVQLLQTLIGGSQPAQQTMQPGKEQQQAQQSTGGDLLSSLLGGLTGGGQATQQPNQSNSGDLLGSLLGGLGGAAQAPQQQPAPAGGGGMLDSLLGELAGGGNTQTTPNANNGLDLGDLLNAGMAYMQAKQSGGSNASAILQAVLAGSGMGTASHRQQSTQLVASSFLQALGTLGGTKAK